MTDSECSKIVPKRRKKNINAKVLEYFNMFNGIIKTHRKF